MIIYGWKSVHLRTAKLNSSACPVCGERGGLFTSIFSKHAHIFWIPLLPIGKTGAVACEKCDYASPGKNLSPEVKTEYKMVKSESRPPIWQFSGLVIIALLIAYNLNSNRKEKSLELQYLANPLIGDILEYKTETNNYSTFKLVEVSEDSIVYSVNEYEISERSAIDEIDIEANYTSDLYIMPRSELEAMYNSGVIYDINR